MKIIRCSFILLSALFSSLILRAQNTKVTGTVYDADNREPLPFVAVHFVGTKTAVNTDFEGKFSITTALQADTLEFSYIGYQKQKIKIKAGTAQALNVYLKQDTKILDEVTILPGENPAHVILRKVIKNKPYNDKEKLDAYQYEAYNKIEFDLNNISQKTKNSKALKPVKFVFDYIDSSNVKEKPYLPIMLSEAVSDFYYKKSGRFKKEIIKGVKISGVQDKSIAQFMGEMYLSVNIYKNSVSVFNKDFVSPISDNGLFYYRYYLIDSLFLDHHWCYQIQFKPKWKQELLFSGNMWIADTSFAMKRFEMSIANDANINYVQALNVVHDYTLVDSAWMLNKERLVIDFKIEKNKTGFYGRKTTSYKNFVINKPQPDDFYSRFDNLIVTEDAYNKNADFWKQSRHDSLSKQEDRIYKMVDSLRNTKVFRTWLDVVTLVVSGYKKYGYWDLGPYYTFVSYNSFENLRLRVGARTSVKLSKWWQLSGYTAYGFGDDKFKFGLNYRQYITKKQPRQLILLNYKNDNEILGASQYAIAADNFLSSILRRSPLTALTHVEQYQAGYEFEPFNGLNNTIWFTHRSINPLLGPYQVIQNDGTLSSLTNIKTSEIKLATRFAWNEKYIEGTFKRKSTGTKFPVLRVEYTYAFKDIFESGYEHQKLYINVDDRLHLTPFGYLNYVLEAGKIWGTIPYPLMFLHPGNETYVYDWAGYNMMNYYEFASDEFAAVSLFHHFDGFFLNKIPLMRKLKWREVLTAKWLLGLGDPVNSQVFQFPATLNTFTQGPYYEVGAGIENIFKIFRIDGFWRLSYIDQAYKDRFFANTGKTLPIFGLRASIQIIF